MGAHICLGLYFYCSLWYKIQKKPLYGLYFSAMGLLLSLLCSYFFVASYGYWGLAWGMFLGYACMAGGAYFFGQRHYKMAYGWKKVRVYGFLALVLGLGSRFWRAENAQESIRESLGTGSFLLNFFLTLGFVIFLVYREKVWKKNLAAR